MFSLISIEVGRASAEDEVVRAIKIGKEDDKIKLMTVKFKKELRIEEEVFDKKKDAEDYLNEQNK